MLSCMCCQGNAACVNNRTCCMTGECNCACMPVQKPLWPLISPILLAFPVFSSVVSILPLISSHFSPDTAFLGFSLFRFRSPVVFTVFAFYFVFPNLPVFTFTAIITISFLSLWFICVWRWCFFFRLMLLCFLTRGVQMQMPNEIISVYTASVPVILFTAGHYWKEWDPTGAWLGSRVIAGSH